jgi:hypothetical protein
VVVVRGGSGVGAYVWGLGLGVSTMRGRPRRSMLAPMTAETLRIVLDVRVDGDEISGHAHDDAGEHWPFLGWLGLIAVLDGLLDVSRLRPERGE